MISLVIYNRDNKNSYRVIKEFKSTYELDKYTSFLNNENDLLEVTRNLADEDIKKVIDNFIKGCNNNVSLGIIINKKKFNKIEEIMYKKDIFDADEIVGIFSDYFFNNVEEVINKWHIGIKPLIENMNNVYLKKEYKTNELNMIINSYFKNNNYKKIRDIYFILKSKGLIQKNKKEEFYLPYHDEYQEYLESISKMNEEDYDFAIDEFHMYFNPLDNNQKNTKGKSR